MVPRGLRGAFNLASRTTEVIFYSLDVEASGFFLCEFCKKKNVMHFYDLLERLELFSITESPIEGPHIQCLV